MAKILVFYHSGTGNTQKMAEAVAQGARSIEGAEVHMRTDMEVAPEDLEGFDVIVVGAPTYRHDMATGVKNLLAEAAGKNIDLKGKIGASFGSYGWSGEAPGLVLEMLRSRFEMNVVESPLLIKNVPDEAGLEQCRGFGKTISKKALGQG